MVLAGTAFTSRTAAQSSPSVRVESVQKHQLTNTIHYSGRVLPERVVKQSAQFAGDVAEQLVVPNETVRKGQVLMRLNRRTIGREFSAYELRANISGQVNDIPFQPGMEFQAGDRLVEIVDTSNLIIRLHVSDKDRQLLRPDLDASIGFLGRHSEKGRVYKILLNPTPATPLGLFPVEIKLTSPSQGLIGQLGEVSIVAQTYEGIAIPRTALSENSGEYFVYLYKGDDQTVELRPVKVGTSFGPMIAIEDGLELDEMLVIETSGFLADGQSVTLRTQQGARGRRRG